MHIHVLIVILVSLTLLGLGVYAWRTLISAHSHLRDEQLCIDDLTALRKSREPREFAAELPALAKGGLLVGKYAKEIFYVIAAGSHIDQASIRERATRDLEDRILTARSIANMAVYGGLLGTLIGLAMAVIQLNSVPAIQTPEDIKVFGEATREVFGSFGWAFTSAGMGILVTLFLGYVVARYDAAVSQVSSSVETFCVEVIMPTAQLVSKSQSATSLNELLAAMISDYQAQSQQNFDYLETLSQGLADVVATLKSAGDEVRTGTDWLHRSVGNLNKSVDVVADATTSAAKSAEEVRAAGLEVASAATSLRIAAESWDGTVIKDANDRMASVVPSMSAELGRVVKSQNEALERVLDRVATSVSGVNEMLASQAILIQGLDAAFREAIAVVSVHSTGGQVRETPHEPQEPSIPELLRDIRTAIVSTRQTPQPISTPKGEVILQPIPPEMLQTLEDMRRSLRHIESGLAQSGLPQRYTSTVSVP